MEADNVGTFPQTGHGNFIQNKKRNVGLENRGYS